MSCCDCPGPCGHCSSIGWMNIFQNEKRKCWNDLRQCAAVKSFTIRAGGKDKPEREFSRNKSQPCLKSAAAALDLVNGPSFRSQISEDRTSSSICCRGARRGQRRYNVFGLANVTRPKIESINSPPMIPKGTM